MRLLASPEVYSRGFVYMDQAEELIETVRGVMLRALESFHEAGGTDPEELYDRIKGSVAKFLYELTGRRPIVLPAIIPVGEEPQTENEQVVAELLELDDDLDVI
jgi:ribonuclease J